MRRRPFCLSTASPPDLDIPELFRRTQVGLSEAEAAAYGAPFADVTYKSGVRRFPELVMTSPEVEGVAEAKRGATWWQTEWSEPSVMAVDMMDPVLGPDGMAHLRSLIRDCLPPLKVADGGHSVQERGEEIACATLTAFGL